MLANASLIGGRSLCALLLCASLFLRHRLSHPLGLPPLTKLSAAPNTPAFLTTTPPSWCLAYFAWNLSFTATFFAYQTTVMLASAALGMVHLYFSAAGSSGASQARGRPGQGPVPVQSAAGSLTQWFMLSRGVTISCYIIVFVLCGLRPDVFEISRPAIGCDVEGAIWAAGAAAACAVDLVFAVRGE